MKAYKFEVYVIDYDGIGVDNVISSLENDIDYFSTTVLNPEVGDIGEWTDDHELNQTSFSREIERWRKYFRK